MRSDHLKRNLNQVSTSLEVQKKSQSALELPVVCATAPFLSLRGKELDAPAVVVGTSSFAMRCKVGGW